MALLTQKAILTTFEEMLEEMPFDKITVSALVKRAGISPNTFYYHYQDIYELLDVWFHTVFDPFVQCDQPDYDWRVSTKAMLRACQAHPRTIYHVFDSLSRDQLEQYVFGMTDDVFSKTIIRYIGTANIPEAEREDITSFCRYAYIGFFLQFLWNHMDADVDEIVDRLGGLFERFVTSAAAYDSCADGKKQKTNHL